MRLFDHIRKNTDLYVCFVNWGCRIGTNVTP